MKINVKFGSCAVDTEESEKMRKRKIIRGLIFWGYLLLRLTGCQNQKNAEYQEQIEQNTEKETEGDAPFLLKLASTKLPESIAYKGLEMFKEKVELDSEGRLEVQLYPSSQLGNQLNTIKGLELGTIEMAYLPLEDVANVFPEISELFQIFIPYSKEDMITRCKSKEAKELLEKMVQEANIRSMGVTADGMRNIWTKEPVESQTDLENLRLWVSQTPIYLTIFQELDTAPSAMATSQVYDGLQAGILDGMETDQETILNYHIYEACQYCLETEHSVNICTFFISEDVYQEMTLQQQQIVKNAAEEISEWLSDEYEKNDPEIRRQMEEKGVVFTRPDADFRTEMEDRAKAAMDKFWGESSMDIDIETKGEKGQNSE